MNALSQLRGLRDCYELLVTLLADLDQSLDEGLMSQPSKVRCPPGFHARFKYSVAEFSVLILAKQDDPNRRQGISFKDLKALVECVVDVNLSSRTRNDDAA